MRVLMVASNFPPNLGGIQTYAYELARWLRRLTNDLVVVAPSVPGDIEHDALSELSILRLRALNDDLALSGIAALASLLRRRPFDVAFATHWAPGYAIQQAAWLSGVVLPLFVAAHGKELLHKPLARLPLAQALYDRTRGQVLRGAQGFFPVSQRTGQLLRAAGVESRRVTVVPNGVDPVRYQPRPADALRRALCPAGPLVLSVARLVTRKGIDTVLQALPAVLREEPNVQYLVVGDGPDYPRLAALAWELGVTRHVHFIARASYDLSDYYNACDVFVMPAREEPADIEGFGLVFLEAGACAKPVIGARAGGVVDAIVHGQTGLLVPPDDPPALAAAILEIVRDPARGAQLGKAARERILGQQTWQHAAERIAGKIRRTLAPHARH